MMILWFTGITKSNTRGYTQITSTPIITEEVADMGGYRIKTADNTIFAVYGVQIHRNEIRHLNGGV